MEIVGLQIVFILIALAEWIFTESPWVFSGLAEGWEMPAGLECVRYVAVFGILFAYYIGGRLIYRKNPDDSQPLERRRRGILLAFLFYVPYLLYSFAGNMIFLFTENGRIEGAVFFLVTLLAFIWLIVTLYKMPRENRMSSALHETDRQKMGSGQNMGERFFRICVVGIWILLWVKPAFLRFQGSFLLDIISFLRLLMLIYIVVWALFGSYKE